MECSFSPPCDADFLKELEPGNRSIRLRRCSDLSYRFGRESSTGSRRGLDDLIQTREAIGFDVGLQLFLSWQGPTISKGFGEDVARVLTQLRGDVLAAKGNFPAQFVMYRQ